VARVDSYQVPKWFDLENYESVKKMNPKDWAFQLYRRHHLYFNLLDRCIVCGKICCQGDDRNEFEDTFNQVMREPICETPDDVSFDPERHYCEEHTLSGLKFITPTPRALAQQAPREVPVGGIEHPVMSDDSYLDYMESDGIFDAQSTDLSKSNGVVFLNADLNASDEIKILKVW
jgi:hypothetical protein